MNRKYLTLAGGAALLGGLLAVLSGRVDSTAGATGIAALFQRAGEGLRALSLSGFFGNLAAWLIVFLLCALPTLLLAGGRKMGVGRGVEDWLVGIMVPVVFAAVYYMVNPTLLSQPIGEIFPLAACGCLLSLLVGWLALKLLRGMEERGQERLMRALRPLLVGGAMLLAFSAAYGRLALFFQRSQAVIQGNTGDPEGAFFTNAVLLFLVLLEVVPSFLGALVLMWGAQLAGEMESMMFGPQAVELCIRTAVGSKIVVQATVVLSVFANLLQLSMLGQMYSTYFSAYIPLFPLILAGAMFLLSLLLRRGKELQDDSDSII